MRFNAKPLNNIFQHDPTSTLTHTRTHSFSNTEAPEFTCPIWLTVSRRLGIPHQPHKLSLFCLKRMRCTMTTTTQRRRYWKSTIISITISKMYAERVIPIATHERPPHWKVLNLGMHLPDVVVHKPGQREHTYRERGKHSKNRRQKVHWSASVTQHIELLGGCVWARSTQMWVCNFIDTMRCDEESVYRPFTRAPTYFDSDVSVVTKLNNWKNITNERKWRYSTPMGETSALIFPIKK